ncbi:MAG: hypothetical protein QOG89_2355 [Thermomicrobiales bacterium]|nr:hypothetical protein [Thermomicrobiales bacterium]
MSSDAGLALIEPLLVVAMTVAPLLTATVGDTRQTYVDDSPQQHDAEGPTVPLVEAGTLTVALIGCAAATVVYADGASRPLPPGGRSGLAGGEALVLRRGGEYRVRQDGD